MSGHLLGWRCNICFFRFQTVGLLLLFLLLFFNLDVLIRHIKSGSFTDIKTSHPEHVLHQRTDNPSPFVLTSVILLISSSNSFKSTLPCQHISSARGDLSPTRSQWVSSIQNTTQASAGHLFLSVETGLPPEMETATGCDWSEHDTWTSFTKVLTLLSDCSIAGMA